MHRTGNSPLKSLSGIPAGLACRFSLLLQAPHPCHSTTAMSAPWAALLRAHPRIQSPEPENRLQSRTPGKIASFASGNGIRKCRILAALLLSMPMSEIEFTRSACLNYLATNEASSESASAWLQDDRARGRRDIYHTYCAGDVQAVADFLAEDPTLVNKCGGSFDWEPLMYACYSRIYLSGYSTLEVASLLIEHGANPNAYYMLGRPVSVHGTLRHLRRR
ncbi:MAG: hypothetical protein ACI9R3_002239 [Verrucomicrobiales bacterium]